MQEFEQHYKGLIDESLTYQDKIELIKSVEIHLWKVIRKDVLPKRHCRYSRKHHIDLKLNA